MTFLDYNRDIPDGPHNPSADWPLMQTNTNSTDDWVSVDHFGFENAKGGWHNLVHISPQATDPTAIPGVGEFYTKNYTVNSVTDTQLFFRTGLGGISQLTGNAAGLTGYNWLGGIVLQWGSVTGLSGSWPTSDQRVDFSNPLISFPTTCFLVLTTFIGPTSSSTGDICINSVSTTNFHWQFTGSSSSSFDGFYWIAIGN